MTAFSTRAAQDSNPGILPNGSGAGSVGRFAASAWQKAMKLRPGGAAVAQGATAADVDSSPRLQSSQPLRYSGRTSRAASGAFVTRPVATS